MSSYGSPPGFSRMRNHHPPPPIIIGDVEEFFVAIIRGFRVEIGVLHYEVQWVGYPDTTWEAASSMTHALHTVAIFHRRRGEWDVNGQWVGEARIGEDIQAFVLRAKDRLLRAERLRIRRGE